MPGQCLREHGLAAAGKSVGDHDCRACGVNERLRELQVIAAIGARRAGGFG